MSKEIAIKFDWTRALFEVAEAKKKAREKIMEYAMAVGYWISLAKEELEQGEVMKFYAAIEIDHRRASEYKRFYDRFQTVKSLDEVSYRRALKMISEKSEVADIGKEGVMLKDGTALAYSELKAMSDEEFEAAIKGIGKEQKRLSNTIEKIKDKHGLEVDQMRTLLQKRDREIRVLRGEVNELRDQLTESLDSASAVVRRIDLERMSPEEITDIYNKLRKDIDPILIFLDQAKMRYRDVMEGPNMEAARF